MLEPFRAFTKQINKNRKNPDETILSSRRCWDMSIGGSYFHVKGDLVRRRLHVQTKTSTILGFLYFSSEHRKK